MIIKRSVFLKRLFISDHQIEEEVQEAALTNFYTKGLYRTKDETGILIYISILERRVWVLADRGINEKVKKEAWKEIVDMIISGIKNKSQGQAICDAIEKTGAILSEHFPRKKDDKDELDNLIIEH
jgi:putative membrane protein